MISSLYIWAFFVYIVTEIEMPEEILMFVSYQSTTFPMLQRLQKHLSFVFRRKSGM